MNVTIEKPKIRKGLSYVLQTSSLTNALEELHLDIEVIVKYRFYISSGDDYDLINCTLWLPNQRVNYTRYYIEVLAVKTEDKPVIVELINQKILPAFIAWMKKVTALPDDSTILRQRVFFSAVYKNKQFHISSSV